MWSINGYYYDLTEFIDKHPGGRDILLKTKGEGDITALFESYHAFSNKEQIYNMLEKYKIKPVENITLYDFNHYNQLCERIKKNTPYKTRKSIKANFTWLLNACASLLLYGLSIYYIIYSDNIYVQSIFAIIAGFMGMALGFTTMHDASHYGISIYPNVNIMISKLWHNTVLSNSKAWFFHHVHYHHSNTSIEKKDPDLYHLHPFVSKIDSSTFKPISSTINKFKKYLLAPFFIIFPGQLWGQSLNYFFALFNHKIFSIKIDVNKIKPYLSDIIHIALSLYIYSHFNIIPLILYGISVNFFYYINTVCDHDMYTTAVINKYSGQDWLKIQVCNSGNFANNNILWSYLFGGINFQIEHHLFPNMSNVHYPKIAPIVKEYCKEHDIPYYHVDTVYESYVEYLRFLDSL